jgi:cytidine deaminase
LGVSDALLAAARGARQHAVAPYSGFRVGAAIQSTDGRIFTGCNIENASYGLTVCAERVAIWKAVSEGVRGFTTLVVVADTPQPTSPCGACRQLIWEFCGDLPVVLANLEVVTATYTAGALLPAPFDRDTIT